MFRTKLRLSWRTLLPALMMFGLLTACNALPAAPTQDPAASYVLPNLGGYTRVNSTDFQGTLANVTAGGAALTGNIEVSGMIKLADALAGCYHNAGAYDAAVYYNNGNPLLVGAMMVINNKVISNPAVLLSCLKPPGGSAAQDIQICTKHLQLTKAGGTFEVLYVAADPSVCDLFYGAISAQGSVTVQ